MLKNVKINVDKVAFIQVNFINRYKDTCFRVKMQMLVWIS